MDYIKENAMIQYLTSKVCGYLSHNEYVLASFLTFQNNPVHAYIYIYISQCNYIYNLQYFTTQKLPQFIYQVLVTLCVMTKILYTY